MGGFNSKATVEDEIEETAEKIAQKAKKFAEETKKVAERPTEKPAEKPADKPGEKPADKPAEKPAAKPADKPAAKPAAKPADKPAPIKVKLSTEINKVVYNGNVSSSFSLQMSTGAGETFTLEPLDSLTSAPRARHLTDLYALVWTGKKNAKDAKPGSWYVSQGLALTPYDATTWSKVKSSPSLPMPLGVSLTGVACAAVVADDKATAKTKIITATPPDKCPVGSPIKCSKVNVGLGAKMDAAGVTVLTVVVVMAVVLTAYFAHQYYVKQQKKKIPLALTYAPVR